LDIQAIHDYRSRLRRGADVGFYLAKDSHVARRAFEEMYPRVAEFRKIWGEIDPAGILASDLSRWLGP
jgi:FAD/FMN-containing dehydrogenase